MNATGCLTALGDGGEAFVVISSDGDDDDDDYGGRSRRGRRRRRPAEPRTTSPRCPTGRPPTPPPVLPMATAEAYKSRPRRKDRGAFVVLPEPPVASSAATSSTAAAGAQTPLVGGTGVSGRVSPFRGYGFKTPENGRSRACSPTTSGPLRRQSSESRIVDESRRSKAITTDGKRLSASTKDLSATGKRTSGSSNKQPSAMGGATGGRKTAASVGKPPTVPTASNAAVVKSSPRKKLPPTPRKPVPPKSPLPLRSPKTPRRPQPVTDAAVAGSRPTAAARPTASRPPVKSSPRLPKKQLTTATVASSKAEVPLKDVTRPPPDDGVKAVATTATVTATMTTTTTSVASASATLDSLPSTAAPTLAVSTTTTVQSVTPITASTSATAIATTHAANAVASAVVDGGPIVTAVPPPAAIAANTLATLSFVDPSATTLKPPLSAMRTRDPPAIAVPSRPAATVVVVDGGQPTEATTTRQSVSVTMTTTPPLSYELQEIVVEPEIENQSGRTAVRLSVDADGNKTSSTASSSNGHKTVAWARPSEKIIGPAEVPRSAEPAAAKDPAYKRYARKLCGGGGGGGSDGGRGGRRPTVGHVSPPSAAAAAANGRASKCWAAVWKRRPRPCVQCCGRKRSAVVTASTAEPASGGRRRLQWWRRCSDKLCCCCGKRTATNKKKLAAAAAAAASSSSDHSVGALGIAPPTMAADTFCGKLKRRLRHCCCCCGWCCGWCAVPKFVKRICCCCTGCRSKPATPKRKSADSQKRSLFKCTGCCTNIPKLDAVFVDHSSVMKGAIPVLPVTLAWLCLVFNVIIPGAGHFCTFGAYVMLGIAGIYNIRLALMSYSREGMWQCEQARKYNWRSLHILAIITGTFSSGMLCLCVGKPRFTVNDTFQSRVGAFCVNFVVAAAQLFTVLFCLVGWGWSIWWGVIMLKMAKKYQKVKIIDQPVEAPVAVDHNHQI